jgi:hypothetical protein
MKSILPGAAVVVGFVLLVASALWSVVFPASRGWTDDKGQRMADLSARAHSLGFELTAAESNTHRRGRSASEVKAEYDSVKAELNLLREELEGKKAAPNNASLVLRWTGGVLIVVGAIAVMATRGS